MDMTLAAVTSDCKWLAAGGDGPAVRDRLPGSTTSDGGAPTHPEHDGSRRPPYTFESPIGIRSPSRTHRTDRLGGTWRTPNAGSPWGPRPPTTPDPIWPGA